MVDTPPPTASGSLHPGHVFSYTHTDIARALPAHARPERLLPDGLGRQRPARPSGACRTTSTCAATRRAPYEPGPRARAGEREATRKEPPRQRLAPELHRGCCERVTREDEQAFKELWRRLGLSVDWRAGVPDDRRRAAGASRSSRSSTSSRRATSTRARRPRCGTSTSRRAVAQAEVEDRRVPGAFHDLEFGVEGGGALRDLDDAPRAAARPASA